MRKALGHLVTLGGIILIALAVPAVILVLGTPVALIVRLALEIGRAL
jgi:hypothetical protein